MNKIKLLLLVVWSFNANAQKSIKFTQQLTFEYIKDGQRKAFSVYVEPKTSTWLLTKDDTFESQPEDIDYWVLSPDGKITIIGTDEFGKKLQIIKENPLAKKFAAKIAGQKTGKSNIYGKNKYGWQTLKGEEYAIIAGRANEKVFLAKVPFNCHALLAYNSCLEIENPLPIFSRFEYPIFLPKKYLIVEENASQTRLVSISPTEYFINLSK